MTSTTSTTSTPTATDQDVAIIELAHVARALLKAVTENNPDKPVPAMFQEAITNKIEYYASFAKEQS